MKTPPFTISKSRIIAATIFLVCSLQLYAQQADSAGVAAPEPQNSRMAGRSAPLTGDPDLTITTEPAGIIGIFDLGVEGDFFAGGNIIIRSKKSHECVGRLMDVFSDSPAGQMTLTSDTLPTPLIMEPDPSYFFYFGPVGAPPFVFNVGERDLVTLETTGSPENPPLSPTQLHSAPVTFIQVFTPVIPPSGVIVVDSTKPFEITWQAPPQSDDTEDDGHGQNKMVVSLWALAGYTYVGEVRCGFDLDKGHGEMPASLLSEVKARVLPQAPIQYAALRVLAGDRREARAHGVSYVIELGPIAGNTNIPLDNLATLQ
jgi:hypothetical protein